METTMWYRLSIAASALLVMGSAVTAAELPTYEAAGFPVTPHQLAAIGAADANERAGAATPLLAGMPASPHQLAVLAPRGKTAAGSGRAITGQARPSSGD
jgi:hypothetical protein